MKHLLQLSRVALLSSVLLAPATFASSKITIDFQNCTKQNVTLNWNAYNFNFDGDIGKNETRHGSFVIPSGSVTKTLYAYIGLFSDANLTAHLTGGVNADFKLVDNMSPFGGVNYINASDKISFDNHSNNFLRLTGKNTIKIGC